MSEPLQLPQDLLDQLRQVTSVGVITGAGISAESGVPTYRGAGGVYDDPTEGDRTIEALSIDTLLTEPDRTWRAIAALASKGRAATPNAAHRALVDLERRVDRFALLTQNIDGLHQAAGSQNVIAIHGDASRAYCMGCHAPEVVDFGNPPQQTPVCTKCGGALRPDVVLFGEMLDPQLINRISEEFLQDPPDLVLAVGTTAQFPYIRQPMVAAVHAGRLTLEVNPERTPLSNAVDYYLSQKAGNVLPLLLAAVGDA